MFFYHSFIQSEYNEEYSKLMNRATIAEWNFDTNVTDANKEILALARNAVYILQEYTFRTVVMSINVTTAKIEVSPSLPPSARKNQIFVV